MFTTIKLKAKDRSCKAFFGFYFGLSFLEDVQQPLLKDELRFPQTVEVAVGVDRLDLVALAEREADLRLFAGMQFLTLIALLGLETVLAT